MAEMTLATLFSGGEGVGVGGRAAGLRHLWGIELDGAVAQVARDNGFDVTTTDMLEVDPADYESVTVLHASPPCPNFSVAKQGRRETDYDVALARVTARFIEELQSPFFTLENVWAYRKSESWRIVADALNRCGYWYDLAHVNAADFSVPQTRRRMIVRAALGQMVPPLPLPEPWVGWYTAIKDLIPTLPDSQFAPWQLARLELDGSTLVDSAGFPGRDGVTVPVTRGADDPANTIISNHAKRGMRAFLVGGSNTSDVQAAPGVGVSRANEPTRAVTCTNSIYWRSFLVGGQFTRPANGSNELRPVQVRERDEPIFTVTAVNKGDWKAWLSRGRVVQMTPRALARFQSFPDTYVLPKSRPLACKVIGMAVPPLLFEKLARQLIGVE